MTTPHVITEQLHSLHKHPDTHTWMLDDRGESSASPTAAGVKVHVKFPSQSCLTRPYYGTSILLG